jgi:transcriptional regulator with XRE-family HTH domain
LAPPRTAPSPLALVRFVRGFSQRELARRAGVGKNTIVYLEHGRHAPRPRTARAICRALGIDDERLVFPNLNDESPGHDTGAFEKDGDAAPTRTD